MAESGRGYNRPCRARPADRSLVAEDRSAGGVRDQTGPKDAAAPHSRLCQRRSGRRGRASPFGYWGANGLRRALSSSPAVPLACHSQQSRPVPSGQPRTTPRRPQPAPFAKDAGSQHSRSGFGSKGSLGPSLDTSHNFRVAPSLSHARPLPSAGQRRPGLTRQGGTVAVAAACQHRPRPLLLGLSTYERVCLFLPSCE
jgi:hypothetical protein